MLFETRTIKSMSLANIRPFGHMGGNGKGGLMTRPMAFVSLSCGGVLSTSMIP